MIRVFYGDDRVKATAEVKKILGEDYEVVEGLEIMPNDLPTVLMGASLFAEKRKILVRDLMQNKVASSELPKYITTPYEVILLESKIDKRSVVYKELKDKVEFREFKLPENVNFNAVFDVYRTAKRDGVKAVADLRRIEPEQDPMMFFGLLVSQALKDYAARPGVKEKKVLKELALVDMQMKSSKIEPWLLIEGLLVRMRTL